ncbi:MAG TPA: hypothetical protein VLX91_05980 [Candidatus Acidoferrales bacterium]|nr:hypothetical protein [Candidatus Acidoferrales bacterium]
MRIDSISNPLNGTGLTHVHNVSNTSRASNAQQTFQGKDQQVEIAPPENGLTGAERAYFAGLFPGSVLQINTHKTYSPTGISAMVEPGQIVNRKG